MQDNVWVFAICVECGSADQVAVDCKQLGKYLLEEQTVQVLFDHMTMEGRYAIEGFRKGTYLCGQCWNEYTKEAE